MITVIFLSSLLLVVSYSTAQSPEPLSLGSLGNQCYYLKNARFNEFLYITDDPNKTAKSSRVPVYTWKKKADGPASKWGETWGEQHYYQGVWLLELQEYCQDCYTIKSVYKRQSKPTLYSVSSSDQEFKINRPRRPVNAFRADHSFPEEEGQNIWKLEMVPGYSDNRIRIYSKIIGSEVKEFLYSVSNEKAVDEQKREVFTWSSQAEISNNLKKQAEWFLIKTDCPLYVDV